MKKLRFSILTAVMLAMVMSLSVSPAFADDDFDDEDDLFEELFDEFEFEDEDDDDFEDEFEDEDFDDDDFDDEDEFEDEEYYEEEFFIEDMKWEVAHFKELLPKAGRFAAMVIDLDAPKRVNQAARKFKPLADKAHGVLVRMEKALEKANVSPESMDAMWDAMDRIGDSAEHPLEVMLDWFEDNPRVVDSLSDEQLELLQFWMEDREMEEEYEDYEDDLDQVYKGIDDEDFFNELSERIEREVMEKVMRRVNEEIMTRISNYLDDELAGQIVSEIMNSMDVFGEKGERLLDNNTKVYDRMDKVKGDKLEGKLKDLFEKTKGMVIASEIADDLADAWDEARALVEEGADEDEMREIIEEIKDLLEENREYLVVGEDAIEFYDVGFEEQDWYFDTVASMREANVVSGYRNDNGELTGYYGPGDDVTYAAVFRMALEATGDGEMEGVDGEWWAGYKAMAESLGFNTDYDWNERATRGNVALIIADVFGFEIGDYEGVFGDVRDGDEHARAYQAVYDAGVFTGEGDTGNLNPGGLINRAGMAKVMSFAIDYMEKNSFDDLENFEF